MCIESLGITSFPESELGMMHDYFGPACTTCPAYNSINQAVVPRQHVSVFHPHEVDASIILIYTWKPGTEGLSKWDGITQKGIGALLARCFPASAREQCCLL